MKFTLCAILFVLNGMTNQMQDYESEGWSSGGWTNDSTGDLTLDAQLQSNNDYTTSGNGSNSTSWSTTTSSGSGTTGI